MVRFMKRRYFLFSSHSALSLQRFKLALLKLGIGSKFVSHGAGRSELLVPHVAGGLMKVGVQVEAKHHPQVRLVSYTVEDF